MKLLPQRILISLLPLAVLIFSVSVFAADFTSGNFIIRDSAIDLFGGLASSSNFQHLNAGGQFQTGASESSNFILLSGILYDNAFAPATQNWRWYDDELNETPTTPLANENSAPIDIADGEIIKLRLTIKEGGGIGNKNTKFKLQFSEFSDFSSGVQGVVEIGSCAVSSFWCYGTGAGADNALIQNKTLSDADPCAGGLGNGCGTHNQSGLSASSHTHKRNKAAEYEFTIQQSGANENTVYFFRLVDNGSGKAVPLGQGAYPSLVTRAAGLSLSVSGLPAGTATEGIVTDAATTPLSVDFGSLVLNTETEVAHRLLITARGEGGYRLFIFQRQGLLGDDGFEIAPVVNANESPASWETSCSDLNVGCYGYHSGDNTLSGDSGRFSANDSYAKLEVNPKEVAFSATPVTNEAIDVVFKTQIGLEQPADTYQSGVAYIIVPVF